MSTNKRLVKGGEKSIYCIIKSICPMVDESVMLLRYMGKYTVLILFI